MFTVAATRRISGPTGGLRSNIRKDCSLADNPVRQISRTVTKEHGSPRRGGRSYAWRRAARISLSDTNHKLRLAVLVMEGEAPDRSDGGALAADAFYRVALA